MITQRNLQEGGFTLVELMVSIAVFSVIVLAATSGLVASISQERAARAEVTLQSNMYGFLDQLEQEVQFSQRIGCGALEVNCAAGGAVLVIETNQGNVTEYTLTNGQVTRSLDGAVAANALALAGGNITSLEFFVRGAEAGSGDPESNQDVVVVAMSATAAGGRPLHAFRYIVPYTWDIYDE